MCRSYGIVTVELLPSKLATTFTTSYILIAFIFILTRMDRKYLPTHALILTTRLNIVQMLLKFIDTSIITTKAYNVYTDTFLKWFHQKYDALWCVYTETACVWNGLSIDRHEIKIGILINVLYNCLVLNLVYDDEEYY